MLCGRLATTKEYKVKRGMEGTFMAEIKLIRVDFRLIHGQVITRWLKQTDANRIIVIDNKLSKDPFMSQVYVMAAPPGVNVEMMSVDEAAASWGKNQLGNGSVLILFKTVSTALEAAEKGVPLKRLQIGGLGAGPGRKVVYNQITLNKEDAEKLQTLSDAGTKVFFQTVPEETAASLEDILKKI
ncbi:MAG: mannose/fructose/sorbose transporter subunit [Firmicutes bacterium]|nr:mannose/fructose/sorbose transporter subunit [Bacillota bacterium]